MARLLAAKLLVGTYRGTMRNSWFGFEPKTPMGLVKYPDLARSQAYKNIGFLDPWAFSIKVFSAERISVARHYNKKNNHSKCIPVY